VSSSSDIKSEMNWSLSNWRAEFPNPALPNIASSFHFRIDLTHSAASLMPIVSRKLRYITISTTKLQWQSIKSWQIILSSIKHASLSVAHIPDCVLVFREAGPKETIARSQTIEAELLG
jgi:hypothetical protein